MAVFKWAVVDGTGTYEFNDAGNWILQSGSSGTGVPGSADTALVTGPQSGTAQTIYFHQDAVGELDFSGLNIVDGGTITTGTTRIDGTGGASVDLQAGELTASQQIVVGEGGSGTLLIRYGATVEAASASGADQLVIASSAGSDGLVNTGQGELDLTGPVESDDYSLVVGAGGAGTLDVGGLLDTGGNSIGLGGGPAAAPL